jgi:hypothetical protein
MFPVADWSWLRRAKARLFAFAPPRRAAGPVITSGQLVDLGLRLMQETNIRSEGPVSMASAGMHRNGLMMALWEYAPLRHKDLVALKIGRDFIRVGNEWVHRHRTGRQQDRTTNVR